MTNMAPTASQNTAFAICFSLNLLDLLLSFSCKSLKFNPLNANNSLISSLISYITASSPFMVKCSALNVIMYPAIADPRIQTAAAATNPLQRGIIGIEALQAINGMFMEDATTTPAQVVTGTFS